MMSLHESLCEELPLGRCGVTPAHVHELNCEKMQLSLRRGTSIFGDCSGMQEGRSERGVQEIELGGVRAGAFRVVLWYLYTTELPESGEGESGDGGGRKEGSRGCGEGGACQGKGEAADQFRAVCHV